MPDLQLELVLVIHAEYSEACTNAKHNVGHSLHVHLHLEPVYAVHVASVPILFDIPQT